MVAHFFTEENVAGELNRLIYDKEYRDTMTNEYQSVKKKLGETGAAKRTAEIIVSSLK